MTSHQSNRNVNSKWDITLYLVSPKIPLQSSGGTWQPWFSSFLKKCCNKTTILTYRRFDIRSLVYMDENWVSLVFIQIYLCNNFGSAPAFLHTQTHQDKLTAVPPLTLCSLGASLQSQAEMLHLLPPQWNLPQAFRPTPLWSGWAWYIWCQMHSSAVCHCSCIYNTCCHVWSSSRVKCVCMC